MRLIKASIEQQVQQALNEFDVNNVKQEICSFAESLFNDSLLQDVCMIMVRQAKMSLAEFEAEKIFATLYATNKHCDRRYLGLDIRKEYSLYHDGIYADEFINTHYYKEIVIFTNKINNILKETDNIDFLDDCTEQLAKKLDEIDIDELLLKYVHKLQEFVDNNRDIILQQYVQEAEQVNWLRCFDDGLHIFTKADVIYLMNNITESEFWYQLCQSQYAYFVPVQELVKHQDNVYWHLIFNQYTDFTEEQKQYMIENVQNPYFICELLKTDYVVDLPVETIVQYLNVVTNNVDVTLSKYLTSTDLSKKELEYLLDNSKQIFIYTEICCYTDFIKQCTVQDFVKYQDKLHKCWQYVFQRYDFDAEDIQYLISNIQDVNLSKNIVRYYINNLSVENLCHMSLDITTWSDILHNKNFDSSEMDYLKDNVDDDAFWRTAVAIDIPMTAEQIIKHQHCMNFGALRFRMWENIFNINHFTDEDMLKLKEHIKNEACQKILTTKLKVKDMSYDDVVKNKNNIQWSYVDLQDLKKLNDDEKLLLIAETPSLGAKNAENISEDMSIIKEKPIGHFYTMGTNMHSDRTGAFVVVKYKNDRVQINIQNEGNHYNLMEEIIQNNNYPKEIEETLLTLEGNGIVISGKFNLKKQKALEKEYKKEDLHGACGYIHVDSNGNNPIAVMDADRTYNYSPQQVSQALKNKKFNGQKIIAFGISNDTHAGSAFMKVAKLTKKRLISHNFRILYWY